MVDVQHTMIFHQNVILEVLVLVIVDQEMREDLVHLKVNLVEQEVAVQKNLKVEVVEQEVLVVPLVVMVVLQEQE